jgi:hypothetical protein
VVRRRSVLVGSAAVFGALSLGTGAAAATIDPNRRMSSPMALRQGAVLGFPLPGGLICPVPYMSRAAWGADESWRFTNGVEDWPSEHNPVQALTVHHTGFAASDDAADTVRTIYRQQALTTARGGIQGWGDIGYNLLIDSAGVVYEGRHSGSSMPIFGPTGGLMTTGAHVLYYNTGNIGVCLLGYLNDEPATSAAQDSLVTVLAYLAAVSGVNPLGTVNYYNPVARPDGTHSTATVLGVSGHRNFAATDCPGNAFYPLLGQIRQRTAAAMPSTPTPSQSTTSSQPSPSTSSSSAQPSDSGQPSPSGSQSSSQPAATSSTTSPATQSSPPKPTPTQTGSSGNSRSERGGDEYVAAARSASPSAFPTVKPSPTPTVGSSVTAVPSVQTTPTWTQPPVTRIPEMTAVSRGWNFTATAVGAAVVGALGSVGSWWWRQRRSASSPTTPGSATLSTVEDSTSESSPPDEPTVRSTVPHATEALSADGLTPDSSTVDEPAAPSTNEEPTT